MTTSLNNKGTWITITRTGKESGLIRPVMGDNKVEVKSGDTILCHPERERWVRATDGWAIGTPEQVEAQLKEETDREEARAKKLKQRELNAQAEVGQDDRAGREKQIKAMNKAALDEYIVANPSIPADLKNNEEKKTAIIGFEFDGLYPVGEGDEELTEDEKARVEELNALEEEELNAQAEEAGIEITEEDQDLPTLIVLAERDSE